MELILLAAPFIAGVVAKYIPQRIEDKVLEFFTK